MVRISKLICVDILFRVIDKIQVDLAADRCETFSVGYKAHVKQLFLLILMRWLLLDWLGIYNVSQF